MTVKIELAENIYTKYLHQMYDEKNFGSPKGTFYLMDRNTVPYVPRPTSFNIAVTRVDEPYKIYVQRETVPDNENRNLDLSDEIDYTPSSPNSTLGIQLGPGLNRIVMINSLYPSEICRINVITNNIHTFWQAFLRDFYTHVVKKVEDQKSAINSLYSTRLVEPFLPIQDLLPETQSFRTITTRMLVVSLIHYAGTNDGVRDIIKALTLGTPIINPMDKSTFDFDPSADPWVNLASQFYGYEAHAWIPNYGITKFVALIKYLSANPSNYEIVDLNEHQIRYYHQGDLRTHTFDLDRYGSDFLQAISRSECFNNIRVTLTKFVQKEFRMKTASYTFDLILTSPIGNSRESFDIDVPFDSNLSFDSDSVDPYTDGWLGWSLSGRLDYQTGAHLDSFVAHTPPNYSDSWAYDSNFTQCLENIRYDIPLVVDVTCRMDAIKI